MEPETSPGALSAESPPVALPHPRATPLEHPASAAFKGSNVGAGFPCRGWEQGATIRDPWVDVSFVALLPKETLPLTHLGLLLSTRTSRRGL